MSYQAIVCRIKTRPHPNADRLLLGTAHGYQVVVGNDTEDGTLGVFFGADGQLSEQMCEANDLIGYKDPDTGVRRGGFFSANRRVRSQNFRGEKSEGYWTPLSSLAFTGANVDLLKEGMQFDSLAGVPICNKYFTPATLRAMKSGTKKNRTNSLFPKHVETPKLKDEIGYIEPGAIVYITEKLHGTSGRVGYVLDEKVKEPNFFQRLLRRKPKTYEAYDHLIGTRNMILADHTVAGYYESEEFRFNVVEHLLPNLHKGEIIYFEIVGYTTTGEHIMSNQSTKDLPAIGKTYGEEMHYSYGQTPSTCMVYVYRIVNISEDGHQVELSWPQLKARCYTLGVRHVPELQFETIDTSKPIVWQDVPEDILDQLEEATEGPSTIDPSHIREGLVLRVERPNGKIDFLKLKSFTFGLLEGYLKSDNSFIDREEIS